MTDELIVARCSIESSDDASLSSPMPSDEEIRVLADRCNGTLRALSE